MRAENRVEGLERGRMRIKEGERFSRAATRRPSLTLVSWWCSVSGPARLEPTFKYVRLPLRQVSRIADTMKDSVCVGRGGVGGRDHDIPANCAMSANPVAWGDA